MVHGVGDALRQSEGKQRHNKKRRQDADDKPACPPSDMMKRTMAHADKKKKLTNPLFFISPYRLSVKNISKKIDDSQLKEIFAEAAQEGLRRNLVSVQDVKAQIDAHAEELQASKALSASMKNDLKIPKLPTPDQPVKIKACKIMRDLDKEGQPSRGYGFVEFQSHAHALAALRWTNNNPALSKTCVMGGTSVKSSDESEWPRLIVEFSVENKSKLQILEKRKENASKKAQQFKKVMNKVEEKEGDGGDDDVEGGGNNEESVGKEKKPKKLSRGQRQREKKRQIAAGGGEVVETAMTATTQPMSNQGYNSNNSGDAQSAKRAKTDKNSGGGENDLLVARGQKNKKNNRGNNSQRGEEDAEISALNIDDHESGLQQKKRKTNKKNKDYEVKDDFTNMVNDYKAKLMGGGSSNGAATSSNTAGAGTETSKAAVKFQKSSARWFE
jgi:nucleolar protein 4